MKFEYILSTMLATATLTEASPINLFGRFKHTPKKVTESNASNSTTTYSNSTGGANGTASNTTNSTVQYIMAGGSAPTTNITSHSNYTTVSNSSRALNITELYNVAVSINQTADASVTKGNVVVTNENSVEALGFFSSLVFNSTKPIVISDDADLAAIVANDTDAASRGPLVVKSDGLIYAAAFAPSTTCPGVPIGFVSGKVVSFFYKCSTPAIFASNSTIKSNFSDFSSLDAINNGEAPIVPIIYDAEYSETLIQGLSAEVQGLVVVSANATASSITSDSIPIVYASPDSPFATVTSADVPKGAIAGGILTPVKAQVLLSVAIINGVTDAKDLEKIFA